MGPVHGDTPVDTVVTKSYWTLSEVKSRPFVLTSMPTYPAADCVELHTSVDSLTYAPRTTDALKRHCSAPSDSADAEKPLPYTVTGVPPSTTPCDGDTDDTAAAAVYVNATPLVENCCAFIDTSTTREPAPLDAGDTHSI